ncbi:CLUMA_CG021468, isoform A [Clunio marinus]|uniref:CLUMA_CG021468, isoform A n=1 Tax=Clunio marinus TaxID=568069 RepID=A0A1J1JB96_9DIPT|nr:CLUMA_CG021468, isoform A [Clunio marinus]
MSRQENPRRLTLQFPSFTLLEYSNLLKANTNFVIYLVCYLPTAHRYTCLLMNLPMSYQESLRVNAVEETKVVISMKSRHKHYYQVLTLAKQERSKKESFYRLKAIESEFMFLVHKENKSTVVTLKISREVKIGCGVVFKAHYDCIQMNLVGVVVLDVIRYNQGIGLSEYHASHFKHEEFSPK